MAIASNYRIEGFSRETPDMKRFLLCQLDIDHDGKFTIFDLDLIKAQVANLKKRYTGDIKVKVT